MERFFLLVEICAMSSDESSQDRRGVRTVTCFVTVVLRRGVSRKTLLKRGLGTQFEAVGESTWTSSSALARRSRSVRRD